MRNTGLLKKIFIFFAYSFIYCFIWLYIFSNGSGTITFERVGNLSNFEKYLFIIMYILILLIYLLFNNQIKKILNENGYKKLDMQYVKKRDNNVKYLFFRKSIISNISEIYYISNKGGDIFYKIYLDKIIPKEYIVEDYKKNIVAKIKSNVLETFIVKSIIEINNKKISFSRKNNGIFEISGISNLTIESNNQYSGKNSIILDKNIIANIDVYSLSNQYDIGNYDIILNNSNYELEVICLSLCILLSSSTYRRISE